MGATNIFSASASHIGIVLGTEIDGRPRGNVIKVSYEQHGDRYACETVPSTRPCEGETYKGRSFPTTFTIQAASLVSYKHHTTATNLIMKTFFLPFLAMASLASAAALPAPEPASIPKATTPSYCYGSGDGYGDISSARRFANEACNNYGGMFNGDFARQQTKRLCPNAAGVNILYELQWLGGFDNADIDNTDCVDFFLLVIGVCSRGGDLRSGSWRARVDPGAC
ncbi:hypothetical protein KVT40_007105 [Elsinoe batatas]|uniref:Uncharacterized protein n=1 Tax=Elsinoe batatas TaxID=2601811 RepID=A0A8K0KWR3_9PEZI|nr:hypothetical protein KVT40_007105 [Elsinoe batatas]